MNQAEREEKERLFHNWCRVKQLDPEDTEAMVAYEEWVVSWADEDTTVEWDTYRSLGIKESV